MDTFFNLPMILCAAASTFAYVLLTQNKNPNSMSGGAKNELTDDTFKKAIKEAKDNKTKLFIEIYVPWCGWCQKLAPEWENLGNEYNNNKNVDICSINGEISEKAKQFFKVETFPTLVLFDGSTNKYHKYKGAQRTVDAFKKFIEE